MFTGSHRFLGAQNLAKGKIQCIQLQQRLIYLQEIDEGKTIVDAAKAANVQLFIWSALNSVTEDSGGKYTHVYQFDGKAAITKYAQSSGLPMVVVQAGFYSSNLLVSVKPEAQPDGSYILALPVPDTTVWPVIWMEKDYGLFVRAAMESPEIKLGSELLSSGEMISIRDVLSQMSEGLYFHQSQRFSDTHGFSIVTGKTFKFKQMTDDEYFSMLKSQSMSELIAQDVLDFHKTLHEFGYYGSKDVKASLKYISRKPHTWKEYLETVKDKL